MSSSLYLAKRERKRALSSGRVSSGALLASPEKFTF